MYNHFATRLGEHENALLNLAHRSLCNPAQRTPCPEEGKLGAFLPNNCAQ